MTMNSKEPGEANHEDEPLTEKMKHTPSFDPKCSDVQKTLN